MRGIATVKSIAIVGIAAGIAVFTTGCNKLNARDNLNQGVNAFKVGQYSKAADNFKKAIDLDPEFPVARLYLATAYMQQYVPGADSPENKRNADSALEQFQIVLKDDPKSLIATQSVASLYYNMKDFANAEEWNKKILVIDPNNKEAYYVLGVIAWTNFVIPDREARVSQSMTLEAPGPLKDSKNKKDDPKGDLKAKYWDTLTKGIEYENKALGIDPEYENAMSYLNLLVRYRADLDDTREQYDADVKVANDWVQKSLETTKKKAERKNKAAEQQN
jgi:tetratricopeptide (TPR) repeat protein